MRYVSLFSGIEAASVAWEGLGWEPMAFSEIEPFPCEVLKERYTEVPNLGDVTKIDWGDFIAENGRPDLIVGGSPCQSFSIAGSRDSLKGESRLMFEYIRAADELRPRWIVWENVPGALSAKGLEGERGGAFQCLLRELAKLGYGVCWRVLDAQYFGVAQRRRRVFLVGCIGDPGRAAEVLLEPESLRWDSPSSREKRKELAADAERGVGSSGGDGNCLTTWDYQSKRVFSEHGVFPTLYSAGKSGAQQHAVMLNTMDVSAPAYAFSAGQSAKAGGLGFQEEQSPTLRGGCSGTNQVPTVMCEKAYTLKIRGGCEGVGKGPLVQEDVSATPATNQDQTLFQPVVIDRAAFNQGINAQYDPHIEQAEVMDTLVARGPHAVLCMASGQSNSEIDRDMAPTQAARQYKDPQIVCIEKSANAMKYIVRRLTPRECERLQGFPDGWTDIRKKIVKKKDGTYKAVEVDETPDTPRYKALGNSMAVPVMRWIGERIQQVEEQS